MSFDTYYGDNPWSGLSQNQRDWYVPAIIEPWRRQSIYRSFIPMQVDLAGQRTKQMIFTFLYDLEPDTTPLGVRDIWLNSLQGDSRRVTVDTAHHGGKVQFHKYDDYITYWQNNGAEGLIRIFREQLAPSMIRHMDKLARNALLEASFKSYAGDSANTGFDDIVVGDVFDLAWSYDARLQADNMDVPGFGGPAVGNGPSIVCITTPGAISKLIQTDGWQDINRYTESGVQRMFNNEVGNFGGIRYVRSNDNILHNCGTVAARGNVQVAINAGDGGGDWGPYTVGQSGATSTITLDTGEGANFAVGDVVTIHDAVTSDFGVTDGVDYRAGRVFNRRIVDVTGDTIQLDKPLLHAFATDLGGGVYAFVTKGVDIHASIYLYGPGAVVAGLTQPVTFHVPPVVDDVEGMFRFSWDAYIGYKQFQTEYMEVVFHAGHSRYASVTQQ